MSDPAERTGPSGRREEPERDLFGGRPVAFVPDRDRGPAYGVAPGDRRVIEETVRLVMGAEQRLDPRLHPGIAAAGLVKEGGAGTRVIHRASGGKDVSFAHGQPP